MKPRDDLNAITRRLEKTKWKVIRVYASIELWNPNDRPLKVVKAHLGNIEDYIREVEGVIKRCTKSNPASSRSRKPA